MRVLQVEDDQATAQVVAQTLISKGFSCDTAILGEEAIDLATQNTYDLILLDIMLPDIDGYEVLRRLRDADIHTPVIIQSALIGRNDQGKTNNLGVMDRLIKPFNSKELHDSVSAILERAGEEDGESAVEDRRSDKVPRRRHKRIKTLKSGRIIHDNSQQINSCFVINMSIGGCALQFTGYPEIPEIFMLKLESGETHWCHVCWRHADKIGVMFIQPKS